MSREILSIRRKKFSNIHSVQNPQQESLADYIKRIRREKGLSTTDVQDASRQGGAEGVSAGYISQIENGYIKNVSPEKLKDIARGLGVPEEEIFAVARGNKQLASNKVDELVFYANALPEFRQQDLLDIAQLFFKRQNGGGNSDSGDTTKTPSDGIKGDAPKINMKRLKKTKPNRSDD